MPESGDPYCSLVNVASHADAVAIPGRAEGLRGVFTDTAGATQDLHKFASENDYTLLMFYAPTCDHCQKEVPEIDSTTSVISRSMKCRVTEQSGSIIRSTELWLMSRSCQRAQFSRAATT